MATHSLQLSVGADSMAATCHEIETIAMTAAPGKLLGGLLDTANSRGLSFQNAEHIGEVVRPHTERAVPRQEFGIMLQFRMSRKGRLIHNEGPRAAET